MPNPVRVVPSHHVYTRPVWQQDWTLQPQLYCDEFTECCAPEMPTASLHWNYGRVQAFGATSVQLVPPQDLIDYFVKIELTQSDGSVRLWYGIIVGELDSRRGGNERSGVQRLEARGLEHLLARQRIDSSWVMKRESFEVYQIGRAIGFNLGAGDEMSRRIVGNMSNVPGKVGAVIGDSYVFADQLAARSFWSPYRIVEYLLTFLTTKDVFGFVKIPWRIDPAWADQLRSLDWWKPQLLVHGRSIKEVLDALMSRQRYMSYKVVVDGDSVMVRPFTFAEVAVALPGGIEIRPNPRLRAYNFDQDARVRQAIAIRDVQAQYDVVRSVGERIGVVWSPEAEGDETLVDGWARTSTFDEDEYNDGSPEAATTTDSTQKVRLHRAYRMTDRFKRVYRYFNITSTWDGKMLGRPVVITPESQVGNIKLDTFWLPGMRVEPYLPLKAGTDYQTISENETNDTTPVGDIPDYRKPFVVCYQPAASESETSRYFYIDRPEVYDKFGENAESGQRTWGCNIRPQEDGFGLIIDVHGAPQHVIAKNEFVAADDADEADYSGDLEWQKFTATVYCLLDRHCYGQWPEQLPPVAIDRLRELVIHAPGKRLDYIVPLTIVDLDDAGQPILTDGGFLEDDRAELKDLARLTHSWYATERRAIEVATHSLDCSFVVGDLLTTVGDGATQTLVNTVVTNVQFDLRGARHLLRTQFAELDLQGI